MSRRVFEEGRFDLEGHVLPYDSYLPFADLEGGFTIPEEQKPRIIAEADKVLGEEIPQLLAHEYMMFSRNGNRSIYESKYFPRRTMLLILALGEYIEGKGRYTDKLIDLVWAVLEETSWVLPAHNPSRAGVNCCLPYAYAGEVDYIDLFSATTAATLACAYYLCRETIEGVSTIITDRILYELDRRIIRPFMNDDYMHAWWWTGWSAPTNNWAPWIVSNVLTTAAFTVRDLTTRAAIIERAMPILDNFLLRYHADGGCDEGPSYWGAAGGALYSACLVMYDMTGGYVNVYKDPLIKNMGEYVVKAVITPTRVLNFADAPSKTLPNPYLVYHYGCSVGSESMMSYAKWRMNGELMSVIPDSHHPYRWMRFLTTPRLAPADITVPKSFYIGGIEVAGFRESDRLGEGLYVAIKGGNNAESHNHNDLGNVVVFSGMTPIFIDAGSGTYTKRTFSSDRYTIWSMRSEYHNCATLNGVNQENGIVAHSTDTRYDPDGSMSLDLTAAYPIAAGLDSYRRAVSLADSTVTVTDDITFREQGDVTFNYLVRTKPEILSRNSFAIEDRTVTYDTDLYYAVEPIDCTAPEVETIPASWDTDTLYRITLTSRAPIKAKHYILTVR